MSLLIIFYVYLYYKPILLLFLLLFTGLFMEVCQFTSYLTRKIPVLFQSWLTHNFYILKCCSLMELCLDLPLISLVRPWCAVADCFFVYHMVSWRFLGVCVPSSNAHFANLSYLKFLKNIFGNRYMYSYMDLSGFFAFKTNEIFCALFSLPSVGKIGLGYFQAFTEAFIDN